MRGLTRLALLVLPLAACQHAAGPHDGAPRHVSAPPARIAAVAAYSPTDPAPTEAALLEQAGFPAGAVGYVVLDAKTGETIAQLEDGRGFPPGSVAKLATCAAALEVFGPEHRFSTALLATGPIEGEVLAGDLILRGGGDPLLTTPELAQLVHALRARGVKKVAGHFYYDESLYAPAQRIDPGQDDDAWYDGGVGALALDGNLVTARWRPDGKGGVTAWAVPMGDTSFALGAEGPFKFARGPNARGEPWAVSPELPFQGDQRLPVWRPGEHAAQVFAGLARGMGLQIPPPDSMPAPDSVQKTDSMPAPASKAIVLAEHQSRPLADIARVVLENSHNVYAEMLALAVARHRLRRAPDLAEAAAALNAFWLEKGVTVDLKNGSGMSAQTRISPRAAAAIVTAADKLRGPAFFTLLPAAGLTGSLSKRLVTPDVALRVWAKTGTIAYANGLAGHLFSKAGRDLIFASFVGEPALREAAKARPARSRDDSAAAEEAEDAWLSRARSLQDALLVSWIARN